MISPFYRRGSSGHASASARLALFALFVIMAAVPGPGFGEERSLGLAADSVENEIRPPASRSEAELLLRRADDAYLDGRFEDAERAYQAVVDAGFGSADILFNLGNASWQAGGLGSAVLAWERALLRDPRHDDARANLAVAAEKLVDQVAGSTPTPLMERLARRIPIVVVVWGLALAWLVMVGSFILRRWAARRRGLLAFTATVGLLTVVALGSLTALSAWYREAIERAVVMTPMAQVRAGPAPRFDTAFEVHEGLILRVVGHDGPYARVRLDNQRAGWVLRRSIAPIEP